MTSGEPAGNSACATAMALATLTNLQRLQLPAWVAPWLARQARAESLGKLVHLTFLSFSPGEQRAVPLPLTRGAADALAHAVQAMTALAELRLPRLLLFSEQCALHVLAPTLAELPVLSAVHLRCMLLPAHCGGSQAVVSLTRAIAQLPALQHLGVFALQPRWRPWQLPCTHYLRLPAFAFALPAIVPSILTRRWSPPPWPRALSALLCLTVRVLRRFRTSPSTWLY
jgi:hypothetical protein